MRKNISQIDDLKKICEQLTHSFCFPQIVLLVGDLGVGKTQTVKFMLEALGCKKEEVSSPAYSLIHLYQHKDLNIAHVDLYRLDQGGDIESTGFWDIFTSCQIVFIEWADKMQDPLPDWNQLTLRFSFEDKDKRFLEVS